LADFPVVEDLPVLLGQINKIRRGDTPFSGRSFYDDDQKLTVKFG
jgi:hypothetical protein